MGGDHLQWRVLVGRAGRPVVRKSGSRRRGGRAVRGRHAWPQPVRVRRPRERRVRVRHLVQPVSGGPGELGRGPLRRPVPQYPVDAAHRGRRAVSAHSCNTQRAARSLVNAFQMALRRSRHLVLLQIVIVDSSKRTTSRSRRHISNGETIDFAKNRVVQFTRRKRPNSEFLVRLSTTRRASVLGICLTNYQHCLTKNRPNPFDFSDLHYVKHWLAAFDWQPTKTIFRTNSPKLERSSFIRFELEKNRTTSWIYCFIFNNSFKITTEMLIYTYLLIFLLIHAF